MEILQLHYAILIKYKLKGGIKKYKNRENKIWPKKNIE